MRNKIYVDYNPIEKIIKKANVIIINNSTVGIEALVEGKTVVVLGNSYYDNQQMCIKYNHKDELKTVLNNSLVFKPNKEYIDAYLYEFFINYLIKGYITDLNLIASKTIAKRLISYFK